MRHGKPKLPHFSKLTAAEMQAWIAAYDAAGVCENSLVDASALQLAQSCQVVVCSDLRRSTTSAQRLMLEKAPVISAEFREAGLPYCSIPWLCLPPNAWAILFRLMWFLGFSSNSESMSIFKQRAEECSRNLEEFVHEKESVLFVGHGFMNRFVAKSLRANGWCETIKGSGQYWGVAVFEKMSTN